MYDAIVVGGGPAGSTAARCLALEGSRVLLVERERHPRFHVGESFLPHGRALLRSLGLDDGLARIPQVRKLGASFAFGHETETSDFLFEDGLTDASPETFNVERAPFDRFLFDEARKAGAEVLEETTVHAIRTLEQGRVELDLRPSGGGESRPITARHLIDASGQGTLVGRHLGTRRRLPDLERVAYFGHFRNVPRPEGIRAGFPVIVMCREGWFWFIPIDDERTSVGLVIDAESAKRTGVPPHERLAWALRRCPLTAERTSEAEFPERNGVTADFSYVCRPYAGPGYFLVGDAATFVDPIFSTGVCLGMRFAVVAAELVRNLDRGRIRPERAHRHYERAVTESSSVFFDLVRLYYRQEFRELFLHGRGPFDVHRAVIAILAGDVFPNPTRSLRWRLALFRAFVRIQRYVPLVPRREVYSLLEDRPVPASAALTA